MNSSIPHGGKLIKRLLDKSKSQKILEQSNNIPKIKLNQDLIMDVEKIAIGAFSPLEGFMTRNDYLSVLNNKRLENNNIWTLPITLNISEEEAKKFKEGDEIALTDEKNDIIAILKLEEKFKQNKKEEAKKVFGTIDKNHPGVNHTYNLPSIILGGKIDLIKRPYSKFKEFELTPEETREIFKQKGWKTVVAFHTRNPPHKAHEFIQKAALELVDGLFIHPVIGRKKPGDFEPEIILNCYKLLVDKFYPKNRVLLSALSTYSRYGGPREAIFTGLVRKNYGATHFAVGRDHTGVGDYYGKYDSHKIYKEFKDELGITPIFFHGPKYCKICEWITTDKVCPHNDEQKIEISGTEIRNMIKNKIYPPKDFMRKEIAEIAFKSYENNQSK